MALGDKMFYCPTRAVYGRPETYGLTYESVTFATADGMQLHGWFFPAQRAAHHDHRPAGTVLHCHGNGGNITGHFEYVRWLPSEGWNLLCFDYRGYGRSPGKPTRAATIEDGQAAVAYLASRGDVHPDGIVLFGQSLGGAVGIVVTALCPQVRGIATEGAFATYQEEAHFVAQRNFVLRPMSNWLTRTLVSAGFDPIDWVGRIGPRPTFFVCGAKDPIVDYRQTIALHAAAAEPKTLHVIPDGGHTDATRTQSGRQRFIDFFQQCIHRTPATNHRPPR